MESVAPVRYDRTMRTTLAIDDDVLLAARCVAAEERVSLGAAISILARRGMPEIGMRIGEDGFPEIDLPPGLPIITSEDVARILADFP